MKQGDDIDKDKDVFNSSDGSKQGDDLEDCEILHASKMDGLNTDN